MTSAKRDRCTGHGNRTIWNLLPQDSGQGRLPYLITQHVRTISTLAVRKQIIDGHFDSVSGEEDWSPRYNVAPTQPVPIIRQHLKEPLRDLSLVGWGLRCCLVCC